MHCYLQLSSTNGLLAYSRVWTLARHAGDTFNLRAGSASFGAQRDFVLRWNGDPSVKWGAPLGAGDLLVMRGDVQASVLQAERGPPCGRDSKSAKS